MLDRSLLFSCAFFAGIVAAPLTAHAGFDWTPPPQAAAPSPAGQGAVPAMQDNGPLTPGPEAVEALPVPVEGVHAQPVPQDLPMAAAPAAPAPVPAMQSLPPVKTVASEPLPSEQLSSQQAPLELTNTAQPAPLDPAMQQSLPDDVVAAAAAAAPAPISAPVAAPEVKAPLKPVAAPAPVSAPVSGPEGAGEVIQGFGKDIPLALALRDIVPSSYAYSFADPSAAGRSVSWRGGKPWQTVLNDALAPLGMTARVEGKAVMIGGSAAGSLASAPAAAPAPVADMKVADTTMPPALPVPGAAPVPAVDAALVGVQPVPVMDVKRTAKWTARPGQTLRETMESWAQQAHVDVEWSSTYDYPINKPFEMTATYGDAVASLLSQYDKEMPRPRGRLYPNLPTGPSVLVVN